MLAGDELKGLRGLWYYLAGAASELAYQQSNDSAYSTIAIDLYQRATACVPSVGWLRVLATRVSALDKRSTPELDSLLESNVERIEMLFDSRAYASPRRFEKDVKEILAGLDLDDDSDSFEEAHRRLGELLGFEAGNSDSDGAPDPWWISNGDLCLVAEDKNDSKPSSPVSIKHTRQAASHPKWIKGNVPLNAGAKVYAVLVTPAKRIHRDVPTYADEVGWWHIDAFRKWARSVVVVMRLLRSTFTGPGNIAWRKKVRDELRQRKLDPHSVVAAAMKVALRDVAIE